jgi:hypothetical protein
VHAHRLRPKNQGVVIGAAVGFEESHIHDQSLPDHGIALVEACGEGLTEQDLVIAFATKLGSELFGGRLTARRCHPTRPQPRLRLWCDVYRFHRRAGHEARLQQEQQYPAQHEMQRASLPQALP